jgi:pyruvate dehydrogenase kinase 2/3/4
MNSEVNALLSFPIILMQGYSAVVIPNLSLGLSLSSPYLSPDHLDSFMRRMLVSRISRRVLTEHHLALSNAFAAQDTNTEGEEGHVGIIYTGLSVEKSVHRCTKLLREVPRDIEVDNSAEWPEVIVEGHLDARFAYIREHLE